MKGIYGMRVKWVGLFSAFMVMGFSFTAFGAQLESLSISVKDNYSVGEIKEPSITVNSSACQLGDISYNRELEKWKPGKKVEVELTLSSSDRAFSNSYTKAQCRISGGSFISARALDENTLVVRASYVPVIGLGETERAAWSDRTRTNAVWKKVEFATAYELILYEGNTNVKSMTVKTNVADLSQYMKSGRNYTYEVRAIGETASERKYLKTGEYVQSENAVAAELGDTTGRWNHSNEGKRYRDESGNYVNSQWKMIYGKWYYFDDHGNAVTGWQLIGGKWYYMNENGEMRTGWMQVGPDWYFMNPDGVMQTGWIQPQPGVWYYLDDNGAMLFNMIVGNYKLDDSGLWVP